MRREDSSPPWRILTVGTGGQGVLTAAHLLARFFVARGHDVVSGQLHGMAQRGGAVQSSVMVDSGISPVMREGRADFVLGLEPVECARALHFVSSETSVFMNTTMVTPFVVTQNQARGRDHAEPPSVAELEESVRCVTPHVCAVDATALAEEAGSVRTLNLVMLGALFGAGLLRYGPGDFTGTVKISPENGRAFSSGVTIGRTLP